MSKSIHMWNFMCNVHIFLFILFYIKILKQNKFIIGKARGGLQKLYETYHKWTKC